MSLAVAVLKERIEGERRVALDPVSANKLAKKGFQVLIENGAGDAAGFTDEQYSDCTLLDDAEIILTMADIWLWVQVPATEQLANLPDGRLCMGLVFAHRNPAVIDTLNKHRHTCMAMELVPAMNRTRSMDVLSSQATIAGYQAALRAATLAPRLFPMLTTAAGTLRPATVIVIGTGVAGLQAIATARRLGARVEAWDSRSAAREEVESLGAIMIDSGISATAESEDEGKGEDGDARELTEEQDQQPADKLAEHLANADVVIATTDIPGRPAPIIITEAMVESMNPGSVIIDLVVDSGGNCALTEPGTTIVHNGVLIDGPLDLASGAAIHASEMYARNLLDLLELLVEDDTVKIDREDAVIEGTLLTYEGELVHVVTAEWLASGTVNETRED